MKAFVLLLVLIPCFVHAQTKTGQEALAAIGAPTSLFEIAKGTEATALEFLGEPDSIVVERREMGWLTKSMTYNAGGLSISVVLCDDEVAQEFEAECEPEGTNRRVHAISWARLGGDEEATLSLYRFATESIRGASTHMLTECDQDHYAVDGVVVEVRISFDRTAVSLWVMPQWEDQDITHWNPLHD